MSSTTVFLHERLENLRDVASDLRNDAKAWDRLGFESIALNITDMANRVDDEVERIDKLIGVIMDERLKDAQRMTGTVLSAMSADK